jgi:hypothetical protein
VASRPRAAGYTCAHNVCTIIDTLIRAFLGVQVVLRSVYLQYPARDPTAGLLDVTDTAQANKGFYAMVGTRPCCHDCRRRNSCAPVAGSPAARFST